MQLIYLDNAATTFPKPREVISETSRCMLEYCGNPGRSSHSMSVKSAEKIFECRCAAADLFGTDKPENVVFTYNTTYALNIALKSRVKYGDHIIISNIEHNSIYRPVAELARRGIITYDIFKWSDDTDSVLFDIKSKIRRNTSIIACTHASNVCGAVNPISEIGELCDKYGIYFIVDGAQSAGIFDIDIEKMKIDALCVPGHKGLYAPQGCAMIIFRTSDQNDETNSFNHAFTNKNRVGDTVIEGGNGINSRDIYMPDFYPERYEAGTLAVPNIVGLLEGINWIKKTGIQNIHEHEKNLALEMINSLKNMDNIKLYLAGEQSGTFMFNIEGKDSETTAKLLNNARICVRSGFHCSPLAHDMLGTGDSGAVRISFGSFNKYSDVVYSMNTIKNICRS